jgi:two-component system, chemotaxis family, protein-glutamate methylesterase/glutaminase
VTLHRCFGAESTHTTSRRPSFTATALLAGQSEKIEESLWVSLRMLEERRNLLNNMARKETRAPVKRSHAERAKETAVHVERIRDMLLAREAD